MGLAESKATCPWFHRPPHLASLAARQSAVNKEVEFCLKTRLNNHRTVLSYVYIYIYIYAYIYTFSLLYFCTMQSM